MACHKEKDLKVSNLDSHYKPSYDKLSKAFWEMHADALNSLTRSLYNFTTWERNFKS